LLVGALSQMFQEIDFYARDTEDGDPGWSVLLDVNRIPDDKLPWLAQCVGVQLNASLPAAAQRTLLRAVPGWSRGTKSALVAAVQAHLTGDKNVLIRERDLSAYRLTVVTFDTETPDTEAVHQAILQQKPAGIVLNFLVVPHWVYEVARLSYATYQAVIDAFPTYQAFLDDTPGTSGPLFPGPDLYPGPDTYPGG
jgi:hypothetical protein